MIVEEAIHIERKKFSMDEILKELLATTPLDELMKGATPLLDMYDQVEQTKVQQEIDSLWS